MALDLVYLIPAAIPPHKEANAVASAEHRLSMVRLAAKGNRYFMVSDCEVRRGGQSYTIDTVQFFNANFRQSATVFLMLGTDAFVNLESWKQCDRLVSQCNMIVHTRRGDDDGRERALAVCARFGYVEKDGFFVHPGGHTLHFVPTTYLPISSSEIRAKISERKSVRYLLPADVGDYIERHTLY